MKNIETIRAMIEESRETYRATAAAARDAVAALEAAYRENIENTPAETVAAFVAVVGYDMAMSTVATLINRYAWDGRISRTSAKWAAAQEDSWDEEAGEKLWLYSNVIHCAHLDQIARAMMEYTPATTPTDEKKEEEPETMTDNSRPAAQMFPHLCAALEANATEQTERAAARIMNGSECDPNEGLRTHLTPCRLNALQTGTLSREKAVEIAKRRAAKNYAAELEKKLLHLDGIAAAPVLDSVEISVKWKRNPTCGYNPTATVLTNDGTYTGRASGYGYNKLTAAIGEALNHSPAVLRSLYLAKENYLAAGNTCRRVSSITETNADAIHYGAGYGILPYFEGGVGMSSFEGVFNALGFRMHSNRAAKTHDYFRFYRPEEV